MQLLSPYAKVISQYHTLIDSLIEFLGCYKELMLIFVLWKVRDYRALLTGNGRWVNYVPVNSKTAHPPPGQTPGHLTFLKIFGQIPRYVASFDVKCPTR